MHGKTQAYVIAARRTAIGRVGGLHRSRRAEDLAAVALTAALADAGIAAREVEALVLGNAGEGGNPARLAGLSAGLPDTVPALTIDRQCASGLEAILAAIRLVVLGEAAIVAAGGAESLTNAPWRLARPRSPLQTPRFLNAESGPDQAGLEAAEALARSLGISRQMQDDYAAGARRAGAAVLQSGQLAHEIASFGPAPAESRDEAPYGLEKGLDPRPFVDDGGTMTLANTCQPGDGAAMAVVVNEAVWKRLGRPRALRLAATAATGAIPGHEAAAPLDAARSLLRKLEDPKVLNSAEVELDESSAIQALAFAGEFGVPAGRLNASGGALACGRPGGAASALPIARLFASLPRTAGLARPRLGLTASGTLGGGGLAALFAAIAS
jgi:acetyl-CoA C-acetyltransferase